MLRRSERLRCRCGPLFESSRRLFRRPVCPQRFRTTTRALRRSPRAMAHAQCALQVVHRGVARDRPASNRDPAFRRNARSVSLHPFPVSRSSPSPLSCPSLPPGAIDANTEKGQPGFPRCPFFARCATRLLLKAVDTMANVLGRIRDLYGQSIMGSPLDHRIRRRSPGMDGSAELPVVRV